MWRRYGAERYDGCPTWLTAITFALAFLLTFADNARALEPIVVQPNLSRMEITTLGEAYQSQGDSIQVETAPGPDGVTGRMSVRASSPGADPNWMVFALTNSTDRPVERWLTADRYNIVGSGTVWPDLDARRIEAVTPSVGFVPERIKSDRADVFRITLEPGQTITYVTELSSERFARLYLWQPLDYEIKTRDRQLFNGVMLGLTGLAAIFLTAIFLANHKLIFPAAALVSWSAMMYLCVDFGLFHKLFNLRPEDNAVYRAASEAGLAASLLMFMSTFLRLGLWHGLARMLIGVWIVAQLALIAVAIIDPRLAATFARMSFAAIGAVGAIFTLVLAFRGQDRAVSMVPTWVILLVWTFATGLTLSGRLGGDIIVSGLVAGLVLVVILIGFTVTQYAFRSVDPVYAGAPDELQSRSLALAGSGASVWEWNMRRDEIRSGHEMEISLGLMPGELTGKVDEFIVHVHPTDRERFRTMLLSAQERAGVRIRSDFRMHHADNSWRWFELEAASVPTHDGRSLRCVGLMRDVSDTKRAHERLLRDAVHCSLTGLPNRALFQDRLRTAVARANTEGGVKPALMFIDIDKFKNANASFGLNRGDSLLLTVARRLQRNVGPTDTVARIGGDQFAMLITGDQDVKNLNNLAERVRRSLRASIPLGNQEVVLTASIGIAVYEGEGSEADDLLREAELAMYAAKRAGADRTARFDPSMRQEADQRIEIENDLRKALDKGQLKVLYQPIVYLPTRTLMGFEALVRWEHPKLGVLNPINFVPLAEESDLILRVGSFVLMRAATDAARWQKELPREDKPLFVSVNVSSKQLFRPDSVQEMRHILGRNIVPAGSIHLEITESLVMENPEQAIEVLNSLKASGAELALDDFGTGYSSLAYLQRFPFDIVKIDRELVRGGSTVEGSAILRSMIALSHELSKDVVAEGIETKEEAANVREMNCEYGQGFHFGDAIPQREVLQLLKMVHRKESSEPRALFRPKVKTKPTAPAKKKKGRPVAARKDGLVSAAGKAAQNLANATIVRTRSKSGSANEQHPTTAPPNSVPPTSPPTTGRPAWPAQHHTNGAGGDVSRPAAYTNGHGSGAAARNDATDPVTAPQTTGRPAFPATRPAARNRGSSQPMGAPAPLADALTRAGGTPSPFDSTEVPTTGRPTTTQPPTGFPTSPPAATNSGPAHHRTDNGSSPPHSPQRIPPAPAPDLRTLPPGIAASLARLAGTMPSSSQPSKPVSHAPDQRKKSSSDKS